MDTAITTLEFCAGYGGIGLGLKRIFGERLRCLAYCELEGFAQANLISKMEAGHLDVAPLWNDLKTFPYESFHGLVDIFVAGYPCQPFSSAGKRAGADDPRHLWPFIADGIRRMAPRVCFFENVEGHITLGLREVIAELEELGYQTAWGIFSAAEVGAPHQRKRVFILAHRKGERLEGYNGLLAGCGESGWVAQGPQGQACGSNHGRNVWPSRPGQAQHAWEPPRVVGNAESREDNGRESGDMGRTTSERRCGNDAADSAGEGVGESTCELPHGSGTSSEEAGCSKLADSSEREIELTLGRSIARTPGGLDYAELCVSCDNRTDELRLLGNGVVPATAEKAFRTLINEIQKTATTTSQLG